MRNPTAWKFDRIDVPMNLINIHVRLHRMLTVCAAVVVNKLIVLQTIYNSGHVHTVYDRSLPTKL